MYEINLPVVFTPIIKLEKVLCLPADVSISAANNDVREAGGGANKDETCFSCVCFAAFSIMIDSFCFSKCSALLDILRTSLSNSDKFSL